MPVVRAVEMGIVDADEREGRGQVWLSNSSVVLFWRLGVLVHSSQNSLTRGSRF